MTQNLNRIRKLVRILNTMYSNSANGNVRAELQIDEVKWFAELSIFKNADIFGAVYACKTNHPNSPPRLDQFIDLCVQIRNNRKFERICEQIDVENQFYAMELGERIHEPDNEHFQVNMDWDLVVPQLAREFARLGGDETVVLDFFQEQFRKLRS